MTELENVLRRFADGLSQLEARAKFKLFRVAMSVALESTRGTERAFRGLVKATKPYPEIYKDMEKALERVQGARDLLLKYL